MCLSQKRYQKARIFEILRRFATKVRIRFKSERYQKARIFDISRRFATKVRIHFKSEVFE